jgi:PAS domain S-box-containing protein
MAQHDEILKNFSIDAELLLSVLDDATAIVDAEGQVRRHNARMERLLATDEGARVSPFTRHGNVTVMRLAEANQVKEPARVVVQSIRQVLSGASDRIELDLGEGGQGSLLTIPCVVDGARGALVRIRMRSAEEEHRLRCAESVQAMQLGLHVYGVGSPDDVSSLRVVYTNAAAERLTGITPAMIAGMRLTDMSPDERFRELLDRYMHVVQSRESVDIEYRFQDPRSGKESTFAVKAFPLPGTHIGVIFEDISARRETEESLRSTSQFLDSILDNIPMLIFMKEARDLRYVHVNRRMEEYFGASWVGRTDHEVLPRETADDNARTDRRALEEGVPQITFEHRIDVGEKGERIFATQKIALFDTDGQPEYVLGIAEDVTDRKESEHAKHRELVLLEAQGRLMELVRQLSTPLLPLQEGLLVAPLVGQMDEARGGYFIEALLAGIQRHQAEAVLIDITGVPTIDAPAADQLLRATRAAGLLGTTCALVGASPEVARTLVDLNVDFEGLVTFADLRAGIAGALERRRRAKRRG